MSTQSIRDTRCNYRSRNLVIETAIYDISNPAAVIQEAKLLGLIDYTGPKGNQGFQGSADVRVIGV